MTMALTALLHSPNEVMRKIGKETRAKVNFQYDTQNKVKVGVKELTFEEVNELLTTHTDLPDWVPHKPKATSGEKSKYKNNNAPPKESAQKKTGNYWCAGRAALLALNIYHS